MLRLTETRVDEDDEADDVKQKEKDSEDDQNDLERRQIDLICSVQQIDDAFCHGLRLYLSYSGPVQATTNPSNPRLSGGAQRQKVPQVVMSESYAEMYVLIYQNSYLSVQCVCGRRER